MISLKRQKTNLDILIQDTSELGVVPVHLLVLFEEGLVIRNSEAAQDGEDELALLDRVVEVSQEMPGRFQLRKVVRHVFTVVQRADGVGTGLGVLVDVAEVVALGCHG